jgi:hypothetical protein
MAQNDDNRSLREFAAPKANKIQLGYTVSTVGANNFEHVISTYIPWSSTQRPELIFGYV